SEVFVIKRYRLSLSFVVLSGLICTQVDAQDHVYPYFVTYDQYMEELDSLELSANFVYGRASGINPFVASWLEAEYGASRWWTTSFYADWQHTEHEGGLFTGWRFENRFRPFLEEHAINPVIYVEYERLNGADKTLKEVVGFDSREDFAVPN